MTAIPVTQRFRHCVECGQALNVTMLFVARRYRCSRCGATFRHFPELSVAADPKGPAIDDRPEPAAWFRLLLCGVVCAGAIVAMGFVGEFVLSWEKLALIAAVGALVSLVVTALLRRLARDAAAFNTALMITIGLGTFVVYVVAEGLPEERRNGMVFAMMAWLALGGVALSKFIRNLSLPNVGPHGLVVDPSAS